MRKRALSTDFRDPTSKKGFEELSEDTNTFDPEIQIIDPTSIPRRVPYRKTSDNTALSTIRKKAITMNKLSSLPQIDEQPIELATGKDAIEIKIELADTKRACRTRIFIFDDPAPVQSRPALPSNKEIIENSKEAASPTRKPSGNTSGNEKFCRICFEVEEDQEKNPLICPCLCNGSLKHIHQECLKTWLFQREESDQNYMIGARCEICKYMYHIRVEKKLKFSCQRSCGDGFPNLLVAVGLLVCLLNLIWLVYKYIKGVSEQTEKYKNDPNTAAYLQNQHPTNIVLSLLAITLSLMFLVPMMINLKQAFFHKKVISIKFLSLDVKDRAAAPAKLNLINPKDQPTLSSIGDESSYSQTSRDEYPTNYEYEQAAAHSMNVSAFTENHNKSTVEASVIIPLNFEGIAHKVN